MLARLLPPGTAPVAARLIAARALRGVGDGAVSIILPAHLLALGFSGFEVGAVVTATLLGSAVMTLGSGFIAHVWTARTLLLAGCVLMFVTGMGFATTTALLPLLCIAVIGTLNPTAGDVSVFLPIEQAALAGSVSAPHRTALYARYNLAGALGSALGALASALPVWLTPVTGLTVEMLMQVAFLGYAAIALVIALLYRGLQMPPDPQTAIAPLQTARRKIVLQLSALFTLDSFGGGFVAQSLLALWLFKRFDFSLATAAPFFFAATLLAALSQLLSPLLAARIGLVRTMVYTHIPANLLLMLAALMPTPTLAVLFLLLRMTLSSMDVPARQALVMAVVPAAERAAAASLTNVPRSLGTGLAPLLAGWLLANSAFGWPLLIAGALKIAYDLLLLLHFRHHEPQPQR